MPAGGLCFEVAVNAPIQQALTYGPPEFSAVPEPGMRVLAPLGGRLVTGYVLAVVEGAPAGVELRNLAETLDDEILFPPEHIPFYRWIAGYYHHPLGEVIATALPGGIDVHSSLCARLSDEGRGELAALAVAADFVAPSWLARLLEVGELSPAATAAARRRPKEQRLLASWERRGWLTLTRGVSTAQVRRKTETVVALVPATGPAPLKPSERKTLELLRELGGERAEAVPRRELTARYGGAGPALAGLARLGLVRLTERTLYRDPFGEPPPFCPAPEHLAEEQAQVLAQVVPAVQQGGFVTFLLHGVTGSGKTEVYLRATAAALEQGRGVLLLVPEIALATQLEAQFLSRFGERVALLHSGLSAGERLDQWLRILRGAADVVLGARSAVFAPLRNPGLIIVDEEHETAYKQDDGLRYHGRDLAVMRASMAGCPVLLGSATPSVVSSHHARQGKYRPLSLTRRVLDQVLPAVEVVDLGRSERLIAEPFFSVTLAEALEKTLAAGQQSLLFVNRRGFASSFMCRDCGHILRCRHCQVSLTLHRGRKQLLCHYCGYSLPAAIVCPQCRSERLTGLGIGAERIAASVATLLPAARVARLDSDSAGDRRGHLAALKAVRQGEVDILVGTQMIAKGLHFPGITLVGIVWADSTMAAPDFRAEERGFQQLTQVMGRAGRGETPGRVIIQTHRPEHHIIRLAQDNDYDTLFEREITLRRELGYPPFARLVNVKLSGPEEAEVERAAQAVADFAARHPACQGRGAVEVLGPAPAPLARLRDRSRWQLLLKGGDLGRLHQLARAILHEARPILRGRELRLVLDVDPEDMM
ncbi:MAG: primosomal protein N' [Desulfobulbaceae bacterium A2]|nr:MAG: primosomal protein N' [Desulfobulbaceae bacterium A2]